MIRVNSMVPSRKVFKDSDSIGQYNPAVMLGAPVRRAWYRSRWIGRRRDWNSRQEVLGTAAGGVTGRADLFRCSCQTRRTRPLLAGFAGVA